MYLNTLIDTKTEINIDNPQMKLMAFFFILDFLLNISLIVELSSRNTHARNLQLKS